MIKTSSTRTSKASLAWSLALVWSASCGGADKFAPPIDASIDGASSDGAYTDVGSEDASRDASFDAHRDASLDARTDAARVDAGGDGALPDAGLCDPGSYQGNAAWSARLVVGEGASLCWFPAWQVGVGLSEGETMEGGIRRVLRSQMENKEIIRIAAGTYPLPTTSSQEAFRLPMCFAHGTVASIGASARVEAEEDEFGIGRPVGRYVTATLPIASGGQAAELALSIWREPNEDQANFSAAPLVDHDRGIQVLRGQQRFVSCQLQANRCHELGFPNLGTVRLDEYNWAGSPGLGFAVPKRLVGEILGTPIDVQAYEDLASVYGHHAFDRYFFFRFPSPIQGACGIRIQTPTENSWEASLADCFGVPQAAMEPSTRRSLDCQ